MIYLDACATTPLDPAAADEMLRVARDCWGNPSSIHAAGRAAAKALADSRAVLADSIGASPREIVLTSGGTEANNLAIASAVAGFLPDGPVHVVTSATEHASVSKRLEWERRVHPEAVEVTTVGVDAEGVIDADALCAAVRPETRLVTILLCNNETGVMQDLDALRAIKLAHPRVLLHLDIVQCHLKAPLDVRVFPADFLSAASHKVCGPKGAGFLFVRDGVELAPLLVGGAQERFRRAGTEDAAAAAGFAAAVRATPPAAQLTAALAQLESAFLGALASEGVPFSINGPPCHARRMPGILNLSFPGVRNKEDLQIACDLDGVMLSSTSACHSGVVSDSHVLAAMGVSVERRNGSVRIGMHRFLTDEEAVQGARILAAAARRVAAG